jgi:peroxiredoxin
MPKNVRANIELVVNIVVAIAIVVVAAAVVKRYAFSSNPVNPPHVAKGDRLEVPNVNWEQNEKTLVFFLIKDCHYCQASAPFYRQLLADAGERNVKVLAILPNSAKEAKEYVQHLELPIDNLLTGSSFASYKIPGAPSVLFVDKQGVVKSAWLGATQGREQEMRDDLIALFAARP